MRHIIWRNRASAILGLFVVIIPFTGFPEALRDSLVVLLGVLIVIFGFYRGSGNYALLTNETEDNESDIKSPLVSTVIEEESTVIVLPTVDQTKPVKRSRKTSPSIADLNEKLSDLSLTE